MGNIFSSKKNTSTDSTVRTPAPSSPMENPPVTSVHTSISTNSGPSPADPELREVPIDDRVSHLSITDTITVDSGTSILHDISNRTNDDDTLSHRSLVETHFGTPVYTLSVTDKYVCVFVPDREKFIQMNRDQISLADLTEGEIYHVSSVTQGELGEFTVPSAFARKAYLERNSYECDSFTEYRDMVLTALQLGSRIRDFEQRCARVTQMDELILTIPARQGQLKRLSLTTIMGQGFEIDVKSVEMNDKDKDFTVICHSPRAPLPSEVRKGCLLEITGVYTEHVRVTSALMLPYSNVETPIGNLSLLSSIYGLAGHRDHRAISSDIPVIQLAKNGGVVSLNQEQAQAVARYISDDCLGFVVEAPPGSGKTMTAAAMAVNYKGDGVQLFLSTANVPVTNMAMSLAKLDYGNLRALHLTSAECEGKMTDATRSPFCSLSLAKGQTVLNEKISRLEHELEHAPNEEQRMKLHQEIRNACGPILDVTYDIYFATVDMILGRLFKHNKDGRHRPDIIKDRLMTSVRRIVVDEASQLTEVALNAIIICFPQAQIVLIGDSKQLPPFKYEAGDVVSELAARPALDVMKDKKNLPVIKLTRVYRASKSLIKHYSKTFYEGKLRSLEPFPKGANPLARLDRDVKGHRCIFWKVNGYSEQNGTSKYNWGEIKSLRHIINCLNSAGHDEKSIMIISYYEAQRKKAEEILKGYEVLTVDSAQGREKPIIIVLTTRTSVPTDAYSFFTSPNRLNVAVSRHQEGLIVIGHPSIKDAPHWVDVLDEKYFKHIDDRA